MSNINSTVQMKYHTHTGYNLHVTPPITISHSHKLYNNTPKLPNKSRWLQVTLPKPLISHKHSTKSIHLTSHAGYRLTAYTVTRSHHSHHSHSHTQPHVTRPTQDKKTWLSLLLSLLTVCLSSLRAAHSHSLSELAAHSLSSLLTVWAAHCLSSLLCSAHCLSSLLCSQSELAAHCLSSLLCSQSELAAHCLSSLLCSQSELAVSSIYLKVSQPKRARNGCSQSQTHSSLTVTPLTQSHTDTQDKVIYYMAEAAELTACVEKIQFVPKVSSASVIKNAYDCFGWTKAPFGNA